MIKPDLRVIALLWVLFVFHWFQNILTWKLFDWLIERICEGERRWPTPWKWSFCQFMISKGTYRFRFPSWIDVTFTLFNIHLERWCSNVTYGKVSIGNSYVSQEEIAFLNNWWYGTLGIRVIRRTSGSQIARTLKTQNKTKRDNNGCMLYFVK